jgi:hypothetical protein
VQFVSVAVAEGAVAAEAINVQLQEEDRQKLLASRVARSGGAHNK